MLLYSAGSKNLNTFLMIVFKFIPVKWTVD